MSSFTSPLGSYYLGVGFSITMDRSEDRLPVLLRFDNYTIDKLIKIKKAKVRLLNHSPMTDKQVRLFKNQMHLNALKMQEKFGPLGHMPEIRNTWAEDIFVDEKKKGDPDLIYVLITGNPDSIGIPTEDDVRYGFFDNESGEFKNPVLTAMLAHLRFEEFAFLRNMDKNNYIVLYNKDTGITSLVTVKDLLKTKDFLDLPNLSEPQYIKSSTLDKLNLNLMTESKFPHTGVLSADKVKTMLLLNELIRFESHWPDGILVTSPGLISKLKMKGPGIYLFDRALIKIRPSFKSFNNTLVDGDLGKTIQATKQQINNFTSKGVLLKENVNPELIRLLVEERVKRLVQSGRASTPAQSGGPYGSIRSVNVDIDLPFYPYGYDNEWIIIRDTSAKHGGSVNGDKPYRVIPKVSVPNLETKATFDSELGVWKLNPGQTQWGTNALANDVFLSFSIDNTHISYDMINFSFGTEQPSGSTFDGIYLDQLREYGFKHKLLGNIHATNGVSNEMRHFLLSSRLFRKSAPGRMITTGHQTKNGVQSVVNFWSEIVSHNALSRYDYLFQPDVKWYNLKLEYYTDAHGRPTREATHVLGKDYIAIDPLAGPEMRARLLETAGPYADFSTAEIDYFKENISDAELLIGHKDPMLKPDPVLKNPDGDRYALTKVAQRELDILQSLDKLGKDINADVIKKLAPTLYSMMEDILLQETNNIIKADKYRYRSSGKFADEVVAGFVRSEIDGRVIWYREKIASVDTINNLITNGTASDPFITYTITNDYIKYDLTKSDSVKKSDMLFDLMLDDVKRNGTKKINLGDLSSKGVYLLNRQLQRLYNSGRYVHFMNVAISDIQLKPAVHSSTGGLPVHFDQNALNMILVDGSTAYPGSGEYINVGDLMKRYQGDRSFFVHKVTTSSGEVLSYVVDIDKRLMDLSKIEKVTDGNGIITRINNGPTGLSSDGYIAFDGPNIEIFQHDVHGFLQGNPYNGSLYANPIVEYFSKLTDIIIRDVTPKGASAREKKVITFRLRKTSSGSISIPVASKGTIPWHILKLPEGKAKVAAIDAIEKMNRRLVINMVKTENNAAMSRTGDYGQKALKYHNGASINADGTISFFDHNGDIIGVKIKDTYVTSFDLNDLGIKRWTGKNISITDMYHSYIRSIGRIREYLGNTIDPVFDRWLLEQERVLKGEYVRGKLTLRGRRLLIGGLQTLGAMIGVIGPKTGVLAAIGSPWLADSMKMRDTLIESGDWTDEDESKYQTYDWTWTALWLEKITFGSRHLIEFSESILGKAVGPSVSWVWDQIPHNKRIQNWTGDGIVSAFEFIKESIGDENINTLGSALDWVNEKAKFLEDARTLSILDSTRLNKEHYDKLKSR